MVVVLSLQSLSISPCTCPRVDRTQVKVDLVNLGLRTEFEIIYAMYMEK